MIRPQHAEQMSFEWTAVALNYCDVLGEQMFAM